MRKLLAVAVLSLSFIAVGCSGVPHIVVRQYHNSVGRAFIEYLGADESLDENRRRIRRQAYDSMEKRLKEAGV